MAYVYKHRAPARRSKPRLAHGRPPYPAMTTSPRSQQGPSRKTSWRDWLRTIILQLTIETQERRASRQVLREIDHTLAEIRKSRRVFARSSAATSAILDRLETRRHGT
ncbi:MAG: hypothetical protein M3R24_00150 [Chloroflexota bacterium]|nr:hypothetical protein [Chloroflexota bacterium]